MSGRVWAWGRNSYGQLGDGAEEYRHSPAMVMEGILLPYEISAAVKLYSLVYSEGSVKMI